MKTQSSINSTFKQQLSNQSLFPKRQATARKINRIMSQKLDKTYQTKSNLSIILSL